MFGKASKENIFPKAAVVVKHTNPCGVSISTSSSDALKRALDADRISAFGGIVSCNYKIKKKLATHLSKIFLDDDIYCGCLTFSAQLFIRYWRMDT